MLEKNENRHHESNEASEKTENNSNKVNIAEKIKAMEAELSELSEENRKNKESNELQARERECNEKIEEIENQSGQKVSEEDKRKIHERMMDEWQAGAAKTYERYKVLNSKMQALLALDRMYDQFPDNSQRIAALRKSLELFLSGIAGLDDPVKAEIIRSLEGCSGIEDKDEFINAVFSVSEPLLEMRRASDEYIPIGANGLTVELSKHAAKLHFAPNEKGSLSMFKRIEDDLHLLADFIKDKPEISEVSGHSWLVFRMKKRFKDWGFKISDYVWKDNAGRDAQEMAMTREEFLDRWENNPEKRQPTEMEISLAMEDELRDIQAQLKNAELSKDDKDELYFQEKKVLKDISRRAKSMHQERELARKKEPRPSPEVQIENLIKKEADRNGQVNFIIDRLVISFEFAKDFVSEAQAKEMLAAVNSCREIKDDSKFAQELLKILEPVLKIDSDPVVMEKIERRRFGLGGRKVFIAIKNEDLGEKIKDGAEYKNMDEIIWYGIDKERIHLHLAPMRTLSVAEKLRFVKEIVPAAMSKLAELLRNNPEIEKITATSHIVASDQKFFTDKLGFMKIGPMKKEYRQKYFGDNAQPILAAAVTREEFLKKWVNPDQSIK